MVEQLVGITLSGCKIIKLIGKGGMGSVFLGRQVDLGRFVAVKVLSKNLIQEEGFLRRFKREARSVASLSHPNIVQVHHYGEEDGIHFIVMEYVEGETLGARLVEGPIAEREAVRIMKEAAIALAAAHEKKIVHRDIKPDNIILSREGEVKVTDFGLAKQLSGGDQQSLVTKQIIGTPAYISPEQIKGAPIDPRSDMYSLGATIYHAVAGKPPFTAKNPFELLEKHLKEKPAAPNEIKEDLSQGMTDVILKCIEKDPRYRYQSPEELVEDLDRLQAGERPIGARRPLSARLVWPVRLALAAGLVAVVAWAGLRLAPRWTGNDARANGGTSATRSTEEQLRDERYRKYKRDGDRAYDEQRYRFALESYQMALESKPDDVQLYVQIQDLKQKIREEERREEREAELRSKREVAMDRFSDIAMMEPKTLEAADAALGALEAYLEVDPEDEKIGNFHETVLAWKERILEPEPPGPEGETGEDPAPPTLPEIIEGPDNLPFLVKGAPDLGSGVSGDGPPEGGPPSDLTGENGEFADPGEEGGLPEPPYPATVILTSRRGGNHVKGTVEKIEDGVMEFRFEVGGGATYDMERDVDRIEPERSGFGRVRNPDTEERAAATTYDFAAASMAIGEEGRVQLTYDFREERQVEDFRLSSAKYLPALAAIELSRGGVLTFDRPLRRDVEVQVTVAPSARGQGTFQVMVYTHSLGLSTGEPRPIRLVKGWEEPGKAPWDEEVPIPRLQDEMNWITVRRVDKKVFLQVNYADSWLVLPGEIRAGGGPIAFRADGGSFLIKEVKIRGKPAR